MQVLILNCGSSSLKFRLLEVGGKSENANRVLVKNLRTRIEFWSMVQSKALVELAPLN
jgi:acetate kinase